MYIYTYGCIVYINYERRGKKFIFFQKKKKVKINVSMTMKLTRTKANMYNRRTIYVFKKIFFFYKFFVK